MARPPKTNQEKALAGTFRPDRATGELMSKMITVCPAAPEWLTENAKKIFIDTCIILIEEKKLTNTNIHTVAILANNLNTVEMASRELQNPDDFVLETKTGYKQPSPWIAIKNSAEKNVVDIGKLFGFDPYSATKFKVVRKETKNKLAEILSKHERR